MDSSVLTRLAELSARAARRQQIEFTRFLDPSQSGDARSFALSERIGIRFFGGYEDAERTVAAFGAEENDELDFPVAAVEIAWNAKYAQIAHRDVLGALMNLGMTREALGDILVDEGRAICFTLKDMAPYICTNLERVGNASVKVSSMEGEVALPPPKVKRITDTLASVRLDAVVASAYSLSREKAAAAIKAGMVKLNHKEEIRPDMKVPEGSMLSFRGRGRAKLLEIGNLSKKGRTYVNLERYL